MAHCRAAGARGDGSAGGCTAAHLPADSVTVVTRTVMCIACWHIVSSESIEGERYLWFTVKQEKRGRGGRQLYKRRMYGFKDPIKLVNVKR